MTKYSLKTIVLLLLAINLIFFAAGRLGIGNDIFGFMTQAGRFDDFFNLFNFAIDLPNPNSAIQYTGVSIFLGRIFINSQILATYIAIIFIIFPLLIIYHLVSQIDEKKSKWIIIFLVISYPFLFGFFRGNPTLIGVLWSIVAIIAFNCSKYKLSKFAIIFGSLFHPVPALFSILFLCRGLKQFIYLNFQILLCQLISYLVLDFNIILTLNKISKSLNVYKTEYIIGGGGDLYNNSLFFILKIINDGNDTFINNALTFIPIFVLLVAIIQFLYAVKSYDLKSSIYAICIYYLPLFIVISSPVSADYRLGYLLIPIALMLIYSFYTIPLFLLLIIITPKHFIFFSSYVKHMHPNDIFVYPDLINTLGITLNSLINPFFLLLALLYPINHIIPLVKIIAPRPFNDITGKNS